MSPAGILLVLIFLSGPAGANDWRAQAKKRYHAVKIYRQGAGSYQKPQYYYAAPSPQSFPTSPWPAPAYQAPAAEKPQFTISHSNFKAPPPGYEWPAQKPAPADSGPRHPPVMTEFSDQFTDAVSSYIKEQTLKNNGVFLLRYGDEAKPRPVKFLRVRADMITSYSTQEAFGRVEFESADASRRRVDADFYVEADDKRWEVTRVVVYRPAERKPLISESETLVTGEAAEPPKQAPKPTAPARLTAEIEFKEPSGNDALDGGETAELLVTVYNAGPGPAYAVALAPRLEPKVRGVSVPRRVEVGDLKPKQKAARSVRVEASEAAPAGKAKIIVDVVEANGFDAEAMIVEFETEAFEAPKLELAGLSIGGAGVVRAGEPTELTVLIRNAGAGPAENASASLSLGSSEIFMSGEARAALGEIAPGQSVKAVFEFFVNKRHKSGEALPISLTVAESHGRFGFSAQPLRLVLDRAAPSSRVLSVRAKAPAPVVQTAEVEDVDAPPETKTEIDRDAYAVVVGIEKYRDVPGVDFAARDAQTFQSYLTQAMGFDSKNVIVLQNERATLTDLATYLGPWLEDRVSAKSRVFVFYAGHGGPDVKTGESYLIPYDGNPSYPETKAYPVKRLYELLGKLPAREIIVALDACFSGAGGRSVIAAGARPLAAVKTAAPGKNVVVFSAASSQQISVSYPEGKHGMMTYFLLKGLRGAADADADGRVTTAELFTYVGPSVERQARLQHVEQTPRLLPEAGELGARGSSVWLKLR